MNSKDINFKIERALVLTAEMIDLARQEEWDKVSSLDVERKKVISELFPIESDEHSESIQNELQQLIALNTQLEELSILARKESQTQINNLTQKRKASSAYQST